MSPSKEDPKLEEVKWEDLPENSSLDEAPKIEPFTERDKFKLAGQLLLGLFILFFISIGFYGLCPSEPNKYIFDSIKQIIPPIVTLIIGYYFSNRA